MSNCPCCVNVISPRIHRGRTCPAGIFPLRLGGQHIGPTGGNVCRLLGIQTGQENLGIRPTDFFHRTVRVVRPLARRGTQAVGITGHHRLVLGLGHLVFAEVKSFGQGDIVLRFIGSPTRFRGRTAHRKGARFHPEHLQLDGGIQVGVVRARLSDIDYAGGVRLITGSVGYGIGKVYTPVVLTSTVPVMVMELVRLPSRLSLAVAPGSTQAEFFAWDILASPSRVSTGLVVSTTVTVREALASFPAASATE